MERPSKLADLKLVSKYYPVANYSYPRQAQHDERAASKDRTSLGSEGSAPGLIDDRTDSEVSLDDDYQYHHHASELWDSFWLPEKKKKKEEEEVKKRALDLHPKKQYPALIPSPRQPRRPDEEDHRHTAWPLPDCPGPRNRKAAAVYTPFPKPITLAPPRITSLVPSWQPSRPNGNGKPKRPPRPDEEIIAACVQQPSPVTAHFATSPDPNKSTFSRPVTPITPVTPIITHAPMMEKRPNILENRPSTSMDIRPVTSKLDVRRSVQSEYTRSANDLPLRDYKPVGFPATAGPRLTPLRPVIQAQPEPQPQSVFEYDDSDTEETFARPFFRFHKRADSDKTRTTAKTSESQQRRRRDRANTAPSSPTRNQSERTSKQEVPSRKRQGDVFVRMLGRRSRA